MTLMIEQHWYSPGFDRWPLRVNCGTKYILFGNERNTPFTKIDFIEPDILRHLLPSVLGYGISYHKRSAGFANIGEYHDD
jgi:hypothetical protein